MATKSFNTRIINKHDIAKNWELAVNFVPEKGELIVYDIDENYSYERFKIGDGVKNVNALPFADDTKVDKVSGKGLSTNDYTTAEKNKLSGIASGAEVNQNAFSNVKVGSTTIAADSKTDTLTFVAGDNITITPDAANDKITIDAVDTVYTHPSYTARTGVPTVNQTPAFGGTFSVSQPVSDTTGHITALNSRTITIPNSTATTSAAGLMSAADKTKLDGIATGANKITVDSALNTTSTNPVQNKIVTSSINTLNNLVGSTPVSEQISSAITTQKGANGGLAELDNSGKVPTSQLPSYVDDVLEYSAKSSFPSTGEAGKIYVDTATNKTYRWGGSAYVEISPSLALGTTSSTAYRGDYGAAAYKHAVTNKGIAKSSGLYKITTNSEGHVTAATAVAKSDITALGIPAQDTTYSNATTSQAGLMSAADKGSFDMLESDAIVGLSASGTTVTYTRNDGSTGTFQAVGTIYSPATTTTQGLMSPTDKEKLDGTNIAYGKCETAGGTAAKVVIAAENEHWTLTTGSMVTVAFSATNTAQNPTLNVNNTGAKPIKYQTAIVGTSNLERAGRANIPITYMYDGTYYKFIAWGYDENSDTKNTTGSTNTSEKIYLVGATSQATNPQTYSHDTVYVDTSGRLVSNDFVTGSTIPFFTTGYKGEKKSYTFPKETSKTYYVKLKSAASFEEQKFLLKTQGNNTQYMICATVNARPYMGATIYGQTLQYNGSEITEIAVYKNTTTTYTHDVVLKVKTNSSTQTVLDVYSNGAFDLSESCISTAAPTGAVEASFIPNQTDKLFTTSPIYAGQGFIGDLEGNATSAYTASLASKLNTTQGVSSSTNKVDKYVLLTTYTINAIWAGYHGIIAVVDKEGDFSGIFDVKARTGSDKGKLSTHLIRWLSLNRSTVVDSLILTEETDATTGNCIVRLYWKPHNAGITPYFTTIYENGDAYVTSRPTTVSSYTDTYLGTLVRTSTADSAISAASAVKADKLSTARTIALSGGATGTATSFDGSQNITIPVTAISPNKISSGYTGNRWYMNMGPENNGVIIPYLFSDFAHLTKRGGTAVIKYDGVEASTDLSVLFNGSMDYLSKTLGDIKTITVELTLPTALTYSQVLYIDSYATIYRAKNITLEVRNSNFADDPWTIKSTITDNAYAQHYSYFYHTPVGGAQSDGFNQVRYTFSNFAGSTFRLSCIGTSSRSKGLEDLCLSKKGGNVYGNITPYTAGTLSVGSEDKKFNLMYANQFIGILKGGLKSVDASAKSSYTQNLTYFRGVTPKGSATDRTYCSPFGNYADSNNNPIDYGSLIRLSYESKYYTDIWADANIKSGLVYRQVVNGTSQGWKTLLDSYNYTNYIQAATDDEIIDLMKEMGDFPLLIDDSGNVYTDENQAILLI